MAKSIASGAFIDANPAIEEIILPSGLEIISEGAFEGLGSLKKVNIPESVRYGNDAFETLQSACRHKNTVLKYADAAVCENPYFTGCVYCADCAALLEGGAIAPAEGHRFHKVKEEADTTLGQNVAILECAVCGTQRRIPYSEYSVKFIDNGNKAAAEGDYIVITQGTAMADILKGCPEGTLVLNADGKRVFDLEKTVPGSGMTVLFPSSRSYTVLLYGDADGDGVIRPSDARFALRRSVKLEEALGWRDKACHVVYDGKEAVTSEDARMILRASVRLEEPDLLGRATGKPATETDAKPATDTDAKPATETDAKPATETDAKPATDTDAKPTEPDTKPAEEPAKETYKAGNYVCTASSGVYLRVYYGTKENGKLWDINDIIQKDEVVYVMEVIEDASTGEKVYWGKIDHKGAVGWSMLQYFEAK